MQHIIQTTLKVQSWLIPTLTMLSLVNALTYDLVIIGGGSAGLTAAKFANTFSKSSIIIEKSKLGGDCTWTGCIPSKSLLSISKKVFITKSMLSSSLTTSQHDDVTIDMKKVQDEIRNKIQIIYDEDDSPKVLKDKFNVDTIKGNAMFIDPKTISVTLDDITKDTTTAPISSSSKELEITAKYGIIIATGAVPKLPPTATSNIPKEIHYATYETIFDKLHEINTKYKKITVVGAGPIGCELSQALCRFGCYVTLVSSKILPKNEPEVNDLMKEIFENEGMTKR